MAPPNSHSRFATTVRDARTAATLTQEALAAAVDIDQTYVSMIERGFPASPRVSRAVCKALGLAAPWPAVAAIENMAFGLARVNEITAEEALAGLVRDLQQAYAGTPT
jgi:transcriptional regulator with XRE-family HTH domain